MSDNSRGQVPRFFLCAHLAGVVDRLSMKFLATAVRDNGPAGKSRHALSIIQAADKASAESIAAGLWPGSVVELTPAPADDNAAGVVEHAGTSSNALDEAGYNAVCGARDFLEDVAGMPLSPAVVAERCYRQAQELTRLFSLPVGPASERAASRISLLQIESSNRAKAAGQLPPASIDALGAEQLDGERRRLTPAEVLDARDKRDAAALDAADAAELDDAAAGVELGTPIDLAGARVIVENMSAGAAEVVGLTPDALTDPAGVVERAAAGAALDVLGVLDGGAVPIATVTAPLSTSQLNEF